MLIETTIAEETEVVLKIFELVYQDDSCKYALI